MFVCVFIALAKHLLSDTISQCKLSKDHIIHSNGVAVAAIWCTACTFQKCI